VTGYTVPFEVTVPDGWATGDGANLFKDDLHHPDDGAVFLVFWPGDHVPTDACAWQGALVQVGPTAAEFVDAMTAQASTVSTTPVPVVVGDIPALSSIMPSTATSRSPAATAASSASTRIGRKNADAGTPIRASAKPTGWSTWTASAR
jgi:hypothetical protein